MRPTSVPPRASIASESRYMPADRALLRARGDAVGTRKEVTEASTELIPSNHVDIDEKSWSVKGAPKGGNDGLHRSSWSNLLRQGGA